MPSYFRHLAGALIVLACFALAGAGQAQNVTFLPYIQPGDAGPMGRTDQMVIAWQTDETSPNDGAYVVTYHADSAAPAAAQAHGRVVDNYLSADPQLAAAAAARNQQSKYPWPIYGPHTDYYALLSGLKYDTFYTYNVTGPGLPAGGFTATFHTRKTSGFVSFQVEGDEGFGIDWQGRMIHTMFDIANIPIAGAPALPKPDFNLNAGDNCYGGGGGTDWDYYDHWMGVWNASSDNLAGAPYIRSIPFYVTVGNHDVGGEGTEATIDQDNNADSLACFNNFYDPLNGPEGVDIEYTWHGDQSRPGGMQVTVVPVSRTAVGTYIAAPEAIMEAFRASTTVDTGQGVKRQIDHESNYSFDYGNAHFVVLDANPHLFDFTPVHGRDGAWAKPQTFTFPPYPSVLRKWLIKDLDSSNAPWKFAVYHQPAFSSGDSTLGDDNMRWIAKLLEDHGVNIVFSGHEHNYQRTRPLRALPAAISTPAEPGPPAVALDTQFDGDTDTVADGVIYVVEGAGGAPEFDGDKDDPHLYAGGNMIDQDDSSTGTLTLQGQTYSLPLGPNSWLDTNLTSGLMVPFIPAAGSGPKITVKFKSRIFSFGDIVINGNTLSLYQISEPLSNTPPTTNAACFAIRRNGFPPAPPTEEDPNYWGADYQGKPLNDPLPGIDDYNFRDHQRSVSGENQQGQPALLDKFTITKLDLAGKLVGMLAVPKEAPAGSAHYALSIVNNSPYGLNGVQAVFHLAHGMSVDPADNPNTTVHGSYAVVTVGRLDRGAKANVGLLVHTPAKASKMLRSVTAQIRSSTAQPVAAARR